MKYTLLLCYMTFSYLCYMEQYKIFKNDSDYLIGNLGSIQSIKTGKPQYLTPRSGKDGRQRVNLSGTELLLHRVIADHWCVKNEGCDMVTHLDGDVTNNKADNLQWVNVRSNVGDEMFEKNQSTFKNGKRVRDRKTGVIYYSLTRGCAELNINFGNERVRMHRNTENRHFDFVCEPTKKAE